MTAASQNKATLRIIAAIVGPDGMKELYAAKGGTEIYIPVECDEDHWMSLLFGERRANEVCARFVVVNADNKKVCNVRCYIPGVYSRHALFMAQLEDDIKQSLIDGKRPRDIAIEVGISETRVHAHKVFLIKAGVLKAPLKIAGKTSVRNDRAKEERRATLQQKVLRVHEMLASGMLNQKIRTETGVGLSKIRRIKRELVVLGYQAKFNAQPALTPSLDCVADVVEMIPLASEEVVP